MAVKIPRNIAVKLRMANLIFPVPCDREDIRIHFSRNKITNSFDIRIWRHGLDTEFYTFFAKLFSHQNWITF